jgi:hypothetical protein
MNTCPRCKLPQKNTRQCEYCGLVFKDYKLSKTAGLKRVVLPIIIVLIAGLAAAGYWRNSKSSLPSTPEKVTESQSGNTQKTADSELKETARELSGGGGLLKRATEGTSRGSLIAMVIFSIVGIGYLTYGRKSQQLLMVVCGIGLMGYSYFVDGTLLIVLIGVGLSVLPFVVGRQ